MPALAIYDDQLAAYLSTFVIPLDYQTRLYEYVVASHPNPQQDTAEQRRRLETQIERLRDLYVLGDIDKARNLAERERLKRELALLDARTKRRAASPAWLTYWRMWQLHGQRRGPNSAIASHGCSSTKWSSTTNGSRR